MLLQLDADVHFESASDLLFVADVVVQVVVDADIVADCVRGFLFTFSIPLPPAFGSNPPRLASRNAISANVALIMYDTPAAYNRPSNPIFCINIETNPAATVEPIDPNPAMGAKNVDPSSGVRMELINAQC